MRPQSSTAMWRTRSTRPGLEIHVDHRDVRTERIGRLALVEVEGDGEARLHAGRPPRVIGGRLRELGPPHRHRGHAGDRERPVDQRDVGLVGFEQVGGELPGLERLPPRSPRTARSLRSGASATRSCRARVGTTAVSDCTRRTASMGTPSSSATIIANAVSCPWPCDEVPTMAVTVPSSCTSTDPNSWNVPPAVTST